MKILLLCSSFLLLLSGCKRDPEDVPEDLIVLAMTNGQWVITQFVHNSTNKTSDFSPYKFQFYANRTVEAIKNGSVETTGTWEGNTSNQTITATFTSATDPVGLLTGVWTVTDNGWTFVEANNNAGGQTKTLRLDKQ